MDHYAGMYSGVCVSGKEQSPINFPFGLDAAAERANDLSISYVEGPFTGKDNGHSLKWASTQVTICFFLGKAFLRCFSFF